MEYGLVGVFGLVFGLMFGIAIGSSGPDREQEAVDKGFARYNPRSGDWEWNKTKDEEDT